MKISELIAELEKFKKDVGDLDVDFCFDDGSDLIDCSFSSIYVTNEQSTLKDISSSSLRAEIKIDMCP